MDGRGHASSGVGSKRKILAIDGGGIKGALPAAFLAAIEEASGKRIVEHFDLIAGTSTGGIIALGLGLGLTAKEVLSFYQRHGPRVFSQDTNDTGWLGWVGSFWRKQQRRVRQLVGPAYDPSALKKALEGAFGSKRLGDSQVRLIIPAYSIDTRSVYVFKTAHHERFEIDHKALAVDVALATTAAPTYFPAHAVAADALLVDGGVWANNPAGMAAVEAVGVLGWQRDSLHVLSLGCTEPLYTCPPHGGRLDFALSLNTFFQQGQSLASLGTAKLLCAHRESAPRLFRYSVDVAEEKIKLDSADAISDLVAMGSTIARTALPAVRDVFLDEPAERFVPLHQLES
jgi:uncharacterized protein